MAQLARRAPAVIISIIQGVLPATFLALLMFLLPIILRLLVKFQGTQSGMLIELSVQKYYFCFLFVQLFLVVSIASAAATILSYFNNISDIVDIPELFAQNIPKAANYFLSYMLLQALSTSAGALVQVGGLIGWFVLAPLLDTTARDKFKRQTNLSEVQWGTFFPVYTNLACIGLIYSIISPLIMIFNIITFTLFWFAYRYNTLYVTKIHSRHWRPTVSERHQLHFHRHLRDGDRLDWSVLYHPGMLKATLPAQAKRLG